MPYQPNVSDGTANAVAKFLLSLAYRPFETEDEEAATVTFDRRVLWEQYGADAPVARREDFYLALTMLAEDPAYATATDDADPDDADEDDGPTRAFVVRAAVLAGSMWSSPSTASYTPTRSATTPTPTPGSTPVAMTRTSPARSSKNRVTTSTPSSPTHTG